MASLVLINKGEDKDFWSVFCHLANLTIIKKFHVFLGLQTEPITEPVSDLVRYIAINWINGTMSPLKEWSIYGEAVQTNNDVNGWHNALIQGAFGRSHLPLYWLIDPLYKETQVVNLLMRLVSNKKLARIQRKKFIRYQNQIFILWEQYPNHERNVYLGHALSWKAL